jgi:hypothetical protein
MRPMWCCSLVLVGLLTAAPAVRAGDKPATDEPAVVIRVKSLDTVLENLKLLATVVGREQSALDIQGLIKAKVGDKGLQGIDLKRPVGAYVRFGKELEDLSGAVLIPVADQPAFLALLDNLGMKPAKGKDDIYTLQTQQNIELYLRFAKKYAYVTAINTENLSDKNLLDPAKVLAGTDNSVASATVRLDQIPDAAKLLAMATLEQLLEDVQGNLPGNETAAQKAFRKASTRQLSKTISDVLKEGQRARADVSVADGKKELEVKLSLAAQPGTELAKTLQQAGKAKSPFAGLMAKNAAFRGSVDVHFPEAVHDAFAKVIEEAAQKGLGDISDPAKRKQAQMLVDALLPTARAGQLDAFFGMAGPFNNHYTMLAALKVQDGDKLGIVVRDLVAAELKNMPAEQQKKIQLDAAMAGSVKIHKFELPPDPKTGKVIEDLPGDPNLFVAFRKDAVFLAIGPTALATLKEAVGTEQSGSAPLFLFDFNLGRMAPNLAQTAEQKELARKLFPAGKDAPIRLSLDGGDALTLRLTVALDVLEFFAKMKEKQ